MASNINPYPKMLSTKAWQQLLSMKPYLRFRNVINDEHIMLYSTDGDYCILANKKNGWRINLTSTRVCKVRRKWQWVGYEQGDFGTYTHIGNLAYKIPTGASCKTEAISQIHEVEKHLSAANGYEISFNIAI